ncbi:MAG: phosphoenolpyruvate synthase [Clostridium sp.]
MKNIVKFNEVNKEDISLVGGKGANLGEMINNGFNVPEGFILTTEFYKKFIEYNKIESFIKTEIESEAKVKIKSDNIKRKFIKSTMPRELKNEVINFLEGFNDDVTFAVRSSATAEDLASASFAGQQDTYLNVTKENILENIKKCFASLYNERAILYRDKNNIDSIKVEMAVVIQRMIFAEVAGIMFTANPVNGDRNIISIDASYGLGEALVSGLVTPDTYYFNKKENNLNEAIVSEKKKLINWKADGGVQFVDVDEEKKNLRVLENEKIEELAKIGEKIEEHYGKPQDIEWCMKKGRFYITQSREITSLYPLPMPKPLDNDLHAYFSLNHFQVMLDPISPMGIDALNLFLPIEENKGKSKFSDYKYSKRAAGRVYIDVTTIMQSKKIRERFIGILKNIEKNIGEDLEILGEREEFDTLVYKDKKALQELEKFFKKIAENVVKNMTYKNPDEQVKKVDEIIEEKINILKERVVTETTLEAKLDVFLDYGIEKEDLIKIFPIIASGLVAFNKLMSLEKEWFGSNKYGNRIMKGLDGNITADMGLLMGDLADYIRADEKLLEVFNNEDSKGLFKRIENLEGHIEFKEKFSEFMNIYDMRAAKEIDIKTERWSENPEGLITGILSIVKNNKKGAHRREYEKVKVDSSKAIEEFINKVKKEKGIIKGKEIERIIKVSRKNFSRREHPKYLLMKIMLELKKVIKEIGVKFEEEGRIENKEDIFYIGYFEVRDALKNKESLKAIVSKRKEEYRRFESLKPGRVYTSTGEEIIKKADEEEEGVLKGVGASSGKVKGVAKVINDPNKEEIKKGEILIAPFTDPGWTPLFINAEALVMEIGGMLTHGTVVAREYGIPAVVGVKDAMSKIKTGDIIEVDGDNGTIKIIQNK